MRLEETLGNLDKIAEISSVEKLILLLQKCREANFLEYAKRLHAHICNDGLQAHRAVGNFIVPMFVECGSVPDAQQVFNGLVHRTEHSWTSLILGYIQLSQMQHALNLYHNMQEDGVRTSTFTLMALLRGCASLNDVTTGREIHTEVALKGFERDLFVGNSLVNMYAKCGSLSEAQVAFDKLPARDVVSWNALIAGYVQHGPGQEALACFKQMQLEGVSPNPVTLTCVLKCCSNIGAITKGRVIHAEISQKGFGREDFVGNALVDMYIKCGSLLEAREVSEKLPVRDVVSWTTLLAGYTELGSGHEALKCFEQMQFEGVSPNAVTFVFALKACGNIGAIVKARQIHADIMQKGFGRDLLVGNALVDMYAKCCLLPEAREVFNNLPVRDVVLWNTLITGYAEHGPGQEALKCLKHMQLEGIPPNNLTFVGALKACDSLESIDEGLEIHMEITQMGFERDLFVGSALVDMYGKCGSLPESQRVFDKLPVQNTVSWNALVAGYAEQGCDQKALECFHQMQLDGIFANAVTFVCALKACGSTGAIGKGQEMHVEIARMGFERDLFIGNTLIDIYAKCGSLLQAQEVFNKLPVQDIVSWNALLAGYAEHGPCQEALECFEQMQLEGLSPNALTCVCALKACGIIGAIDKGREIHAAIAKNGFGRDSLIGNALIDMYSKCGFLLEAWKVFDKLPIRDVVSWNSMIIGYGKNDEGYMAVKCFNDMLEHGMQPDAITFTCLITACSHTNLVCEGQDYFRVMREEYGIQPTVSHYTCMVDLLARSGCMYEAEKFLETMQCPPSEGTWKALLSACKNYGEPGLGLKCFQQLVQMNPESSASYLLMASIYTSVGMWDDAYRMEELRKLAKAKKKAASASIEVNKKVHEFVVGNNQRNEILAMLEILSSRIKVDGHVPTLDLVVRSSPCEVALC